MARAAAKTGAYPTTIIAIEQHFPRHQRITVDELAYAILPFAPRVIVRLSRPAFVRNWFVKLLEEASPGIWGLMTCRRAALRGRHRRPPGLLHGRRVGDVAFTESHGPTRWPSTIRGP
ncbi:MAG: hypothetical protein J2P54_10970 [Bradyrhizobiaceae bacterium]|nr:hypothetical protein [Bradyrhizobiaceae bacterium]